MPFLRNGSRPAVAALAIAAMALSGCGGGGGGGGVSNAGPGRGPSAPARTVAYSKAASAAATAAAVTPTHKRQPNPTLIDLGFRTDLRQSLDYYAVYHPSAGVSASASNHALPPALLAVGPDSKGPITYVITYQGADTEQVGDTNRIKHFLYLNNASDSDERWGKASATHGTATYTKSDGTTGTLSKATLSASSRDNKLVGQAVVITDFDVTANDHDESAATDDPNTPEDETHDPAGDDTDYATAGVWVMGPSSGTDPDGLTAAGAFASGKVPYAGIGSIASGKTSVSYKGAAVGKRFASGRITDFATTVSLTANFDTEKIYGTVADVGGGQMLKLSTTASPASVGTGDGGPYSGTTQLFEKDGTTKVEDFDGKWGGAFYGATDDTNGPPVTAGTFGAASSDNSDSILGAFLAHRQ